MVRGAVFDLDGTLLNSMGVWHAVDIDFLRAHALPVEEDYLRAMKHMNFDEGARYTIDRYHLNLSPRELMREWDAAARKAYAQTVQLKEGVPAFLAFLARRGVRMSIATSSYESLFLPTLERCGIKQYFNAITTKDEVPCGKDSPDIYLRAAHKIECAPRQCVSFEDILMGVRSCRSAGFTVVGVEDAHSAHERDAMRIEADLYIKSFTDPQVYAIFEE